MAVLVAGDEAKWRLRAAVVVEGGRIGDVTGLRDERPQPLVTLADLHLGYVVAAAADPVPDPVHSGVLRQQDDVQLDAVAGSLCGPDQLELARMAEHGLGDE